MVARQAARTSGCPNACSAINPILRQALQVSGQFRSTIAIRKQIGADFCGQFRVVFLCSTSKLDEIVRDGYILRAVVVVLNHASALQLDFLQSGINRHQHLSARSLAGEPDYSRCRRRSFAARMWKRSDK